MILQIPPNTYVDVTTGASLIETDGVSIEYFDGAPLGASVYFALLSAAPTSDADAQAKLICDDNNFKCVRTVQGVAGKKIYAWHRQNNSISVAVG